LAGLGALIGTGNNIAAIIIAVLVLITLVGVSALERVFKKLTNGTHNQ